MKATFVILLASALAALDAATIARGRDQQSLVVHEWGTFTSLQDETGAAIGGINTDDEPVPAFVHRLSDFLLLRATEIPPVFFKGTPQCHPDVTMRLETPVIYFHPGKSTPPTSSIDVHVKFNGGWLSEYYPNATATAPGLTNNSFRFGRLKSNTVSSLAWDDLKVGGDWSGPATEARVWTSPRAVQAAPVRAAGGEAERFLFYRGVAHLNAPLRISTEGGELVFHSQLEKGLGAQCPLPIRSSWLVDIQPGGKLAFRPLPSIALEANGDKILTTTSAHFAAADYSVRHSDDLKTALLNALVTEGLFPDEARALLNTWELSYFKSPGLRVFFLVPRTWTDAYLPLEISSPAEVQRVMVGRIELVSAAQRQVLKQLSQFSVKELQNDSLQLRTQLYQPTAMKSYRQLESGQSSLREAQIPVPQSYQLYLQLGRFRNTLILDEQARRPSDNLKAFISAYGLNGSHPALSLSAAAQ